MEDFGGSKQQTTVGCTFLCSLQPVLLCGKTPHTSPPTRKEAILGCLGYSDPWGEGRVGKRQGILSSPSVSQHPSLRPLGVTTGLRFVPEEQLALCKPEETLYPTLCYNTSVTQGVLGLREPFCISVEATQSWGRFCVLSHAWVLVPVCVCVPESHWVSISLCLSESERNKQKQRNKRKKISSFP